MRDKFMFFGCMKAPLKRLQNKFRFQVLVRIESGNIQLIDKMYQLSQPYNNRAVQISFEINPNSLI